MKTACTDPAGICVVLFLFLLSSPDLYSQISPKPGRDKSSTRKLCLVARKRNREFVYRWEMPVRLTIKDNERKNKIVRGYISHIDENAITVEPFNKNRTATAEIIRPDNIEKIRMLSRRQRKTAVLALGGAAVYSSNMILLIGETGPLSYILFIPAFGVALGFVYYYPATFLFDLMLEHKFSKGWGFSIQRR